MIDGETLFRITWDVSGGILPADSKLKYDAEMLAARARIEAEWLAWKKDHPDAVLVAPGELP